MKKIDQKYIKSVVQKALSEDLNPKGDLTTNLLRSKILKKLKSRKRDCAISK